jgi:hypothetical protein
MPNELNTHTNTITTADSNELIQSPYPYMMTYHLSGGDGTYTKGWTLSPNGTNLPVNGSAPRVFSSITPLPANVRLIKYCTSTSVFGGFSSFDHFLQFKAVWGSFFYTKSNFKNEASYRHATFDFYRPNTTNPLFHIRLNNATITTFYPMYRMNKPGTISIKYRTCHGYGDVPHTLHEREVNHLKW